ncbi:MAG: hypothetical protein KDI15_13175 [Thiothrix sp.]|nr:hypothetical protein [Thiothrix sp.]HPE59340.1 hypothetical protein [Thiolinea sp.]
MSKIIAIPVCAETLTPFVYHSTAVPNGTATLPELIGDRALAFGLAAALGMMRASVALPSKAYRQHLQAMPWRTSVLTTNTPRLLPPLVRRLNIDEEGGFPRSLQDTVKKGNLATFFLTQEVPPGVEFKGVIFGLDDFNPFSAIRRDELVIRIGLHRNGMVRLRESSETSEVFLNAATARLFGQELPVARYFLHELQLTPGLNAKDAAVQVSQWI